MPKWRFHMEARCIICGEPCADHQPIRWWFRSGIPLRYLAKAWVKHRVIYIANRTLDRIEDTNIDW